MTDRVKMLEAVAEAARVWCANRSAINNGHALPDTKALFDAIAALDALPAEPVGETVEVRVGVKLWRRNDGTWDYYARGDSDDPPHPTKGWASDFSAIITARVPLPVVPTVTARVET